MKLALGTVQFGLNYGIANSSGQVSMETANILLSQAFEAGIDTLDTAISYGESESVLGLLGVKSWKIITKLPAIPSNCYNIKLWVKDEIAASMKRLKIRKLQGILLHRPSQLMEDIGPDIYEALEELKKEKLVSQIGISVYHTSELEEILSNYNIDIVQAPLNILDRSLETSGWADKLKSRGVEIHIRSVFLQGLLLMPGQNRPAKFDRWPKIWDEWERWLLETGLTPLQACLRYVSNCPNIDKVIIGVDTTEQLNEAINAAQGRLNSLPEFDIDNASDLINPARWSDL
jgi:aryl-alcohol dehydrogenase-like predicted oxidoreductase